MKPEDIKIGDTIMIAITGSLSTTISDLTETHFKLSLNKTPYFSWIEDKWYDRKLISVCKDSNWYDVFYHADRNSNPDVFVVQGADLK